MTSLIEELEGIKKGAANGKAGIQNLRKILLKRAPLGEDVHSALRGIEGIFDYIKNKV